MNISEYAEGMLGYKESLGFSKGTYYYYIKDFCDYFKIADNGELSLNKGRSVYILMKLRF